jgi:hypothetical protein
LWNGTIREKRRFLLEGKAGIPFRLEKPDGKSNCFYLYTIRGERETPTVIGSPDPGREHGH